MTHTARFINHDEFWGYVDSGAFQRLYFSSKPHMDNGTVDYQYLIDQSNADLVAEGLNDEQKMRYWVDKFSAYVDNNSFHEEDKDYRMLARCKGDHLLELKCCIKEGDELIVCNTLIGEDENNSGAWLYDESAGRVMYQLFKDNGCNYVVNIQLTSE